MKEMLDIYTRDGKWLGVKDYDFCHSDNPEVYHKPAWIWIINSKNQILIQKRAVYKRHNPNKWDMPSAGHIDAGERPIDGAIRETFEEIGIKTKEQDYKFICEYIWDDVFEIAQVYLLHLDVEKEDFKLQESEVSDIKWVSFDDFKKIFYSDEFVDFKDDYRKIVIDMFEKNLK
jgi:isopentenyldiphosphate isomerase